MTRTRAPFGLRGFVFHAMALAVLASCATRTPPASTSETAVSTVPISTARPIPQPAPPPPMPKLDYGKGDCAPRFSNGMRGTCINDRPCNGFGFETEGGRIECACFGTKGGCPDDRVCSLRHRSCVGPAEADFKRVAGR